MEQWKLPELRQSVGYQLQVPGGNPFQERSGLSHTPAPTPADSTRNGNGISTHTSTLAASLKPWGYYSLDRIKKTHKKVERTLKVKLFLAERINARLDIKIDHLNQCHKYLTSLKELERKVEDANDRQNRLREDVDKWESLVESLMYKSAEAEADIASSDSESCSDEEPEVESEAEPEEESEDEAEKDSEKEGGEEDEV